MSRPPLDLSRQTALVTGASAGIGADIARALHARGVGELILVARRRDRLEALAHELGSGARVIAADLAQDDGVREVIASVERVDLLINNAGFGWSADFASQAQAGGVDRLLQMVDLNCRVMVQLTAAWLPGMVDRGQGWVLNVGSIAGLMPWPQFAVYGATKAFVHSFTEALRVETRGKGVQVHLLAPGPVNSEFFGVAHPGSKRPPEVAFLPSSKVAEDAVSALLAGRARLIPGLPIRLGAAVAASTPMALYRPLMRVLRGR